METPVLGGGHIREDQLPIGILLYSLHESICDPDRDIKIRDLVFVRFAGDELFYIRVVHPQHPHVGTAAGSALGYFPKGMVVDAQESHGTGRLTGRRFHQSTLGAQSRERETVSTTRLLDERRVTQGLEYP